MPPGNIGCVETPLVLKYTKDYDVSGDSSTFEFVVYVHLFLSHHQLTMLSKAANGRKIDC